MEEENKRLKEFEDDFNEEDKVEGQGDFHDFTETPVVLGILDRFEEGTYGDNPVVKISSEEEVKIGDYKALKDKLTLEDVGKKVKIEYKGQEKSKAGRMYMVFEVHKKDITEAKEEVETIKPELMKEESN